MLTREEILARTKGQHVVDLPGGGQVTVRALSRDEVLASQDEFADDPAGRDSYIVATALVEPALSFDDVQQWGANGAAGDLVAITEAVAEISGLKQGAQKSRVPADRKRRRR